MSMAAPTMASTVPVIGENQNDEKKKEEEAKAKENASVATISTQEASKP